MAVDDKAFERLLTFYPKRWRETNGEVFLATAIEEARVRGRERPDAALRLSALTHGWGTRLGLRSALVTAPAGALLALAHQWIFMTVWIDVAQTHSLDADHPLRIALSIGESTIALILIPLLSLIAIASLVRVGGRLLPPRALLVLAGGTAAFGAAWLAQVARVFLWAGNPQGIGAWTGLVDSVQWWAPVLVITSLAAHLSEEILRASVANRLVRILLGTAVGVPLGCVAAALTGVPVAWLAIDLLALGGAIILALSRGKGVSDEDTGAVISRPGRGRPVRKAVPLAVRLTVSVGALTGLVAASWDTTFGFLPGIAQLGESLAPGSGVPVTVFGLDGQQMAFLAPLVLLPMWGICESAIARHSHLSIWGPIGFLWTGWALASLTIVSDTVGQTVRRVAEATHLFTDPKGFDVLVTMLVVLTLPGVVWLVDRHLPRRWPVRLPVAVFVACAWTLSGLIVLFGTPWFFAPLAAVALIVRVWTVRPALGAPGQNRCEQTDGPGH